MGQYHFPVNLDKREYLHAHHLGDGLKMVEIIWNDPTSAALVTLTACSHMRGGGDVKFTDEGLSKVAGRWAGDRIVILGDYTEPGDPGTDELYRMALPGQHPLEYVTSTFTDISLAVLGALSADADALSLREPFGDASGCMTLAELSPYRKVVGDNLLTEALS